MFSGPTITSFKGHIILNSNLKEIGIFCLFFFLLHDLTKLRPNYNRWVFKVFSIHIHSIALSFSLSVFAHTKVLISFCSVEALILVDVDVIFTHHQSATIYSFIYFISNETLISVFHINTCKCQTVIET